MKKNFLFFVFFLALFFSKAIAEPTFVQSLTFTAPDSKMQEYGLTFNNDGTKMYIAGDDQPNPGLEDYVREYTLTTAYDISTATLTTTKVILTGTHGANNVLIPTQVVFNNDGTKMFIAGHHGAMNVDYWSLTTAFDISTASLDGLYDVSSKEIRVNSVAFNNDGTRMIIAGVGNAGGSQDRIHECDPALGYDLLHQQ